MARIFIPTDSTEYMSIKVSGQSNGMNIDLSSFPVEIGIRPIHDGTVHGPVTFNEAQWEVVQGNFYARILIGPEYGGIDLDVDTYNIWVKVFATPQLLIRKCPTILEIRPPETQ